MKANVSAISSYSNTQLTEWHIIVFTHIYIYKVHVMTKSVQTINLVISEKKNTRRNLCWIKRKLHMSYIIQLSWQK